MVKRIRRGDGELIETGSNGDRCEGSIKWVVVAMAAVRLHGSEVV